MICRELQQLDHRWSIVNEDDLYIAYFIEFLHIKFPEACARMSRALALHNYFHAIHRCDICFLDGASDEDKQYAIQSVRTIQEYIETPVGNNFIYLCYQQARAAVMQRIREMLDAKKNIIVESFFVPFSEIKQEFLGVAQCREALIYCPITTLLRNILKRNTDAEILRDFRQRRFLRQIFGGSNYFYRLTPTYHPNVLAMYLRSDLEDIFERAREYVIHNWDTRQRTQFVQIEMNLREFDQFKKAFFEPFDRADTDRLYVEPRDRFDIIINTDECSPQDAARLLLKAI